MPFIILWRVIFIFCISIRKWHIPNLQIKINSKIYTNQINSHHAINHNVPLPHVAFLDMHITPKINILWYCNVKEKNQWVSRIGSKRRRTIQRLPYLFFYKSPKQCRNQKLVKGMCRSPHQHGDQFRYLYGTEKPFSTTEWNVNIFSATFYGRITFWHHISIIRAKFCMALKGFWAPLNAETDPEADADHKRCRN